MRQAQKKVQPKEQEVVEELPEVQTDEDAQELVSLSDDLLDEIDSVLEKNAEEFVSQFIQKGGQ